MSSRATTTTVFPHDIHLRRARRRLSIPATRQRPRLSTCRARARSIEALDLSSASPTETLASLRYVVLSYLAELETRLSQLESPCDLGIAEALKAKGELKIEEARVWAKEALDMLNSIRTDVCSHLPDISLTDLSVESFVKSHMPDFPDVPAFDLSDMRPHLPDLPHVLHRLPDMTEVRSHLPDLTLAAAEMRSRLDDVRSRFSDIDFHKPLSYIPTLSQHLQSLHTHLSSMELPTSVGIPSLPHISILSDLLDSLSSSDIISELFDETSTVVSEGEDLLERAAKEVANAVKRSFDGSRLIKYVDLPDQWKSNPFVMRGYRFIPLEKWPLIVMSLFTLHNETLNIYTHFIPFLLWTLHSIPFVKSSAFNDTPEAVYTIFALLCLFCSTVWHTMAGCAHPVGMELCARIDYVGIGWLISASVGMVVHYGFQCHPEFGRLFLTFCLVTGIAGNVFPFMNWFNLPENRRWRITFFLGLTFTVVAPLATLSYLHSVEVMLSFIGPVFPSLFLYLLGLIFYATHIPERFFYRSAKWSTWLDWLGGGSHALWHTFIVLAISQYRAAIVSLRPGIMCGAQK